MVVFATYTLCLVRLRLTAKLKLAKHFLLLIELFSTFSSISFVQMSTRTFSWVVFKGKLDRIVFGFPSLTKLLLMKYTDISFFKLFPRKGQSDDILVAQQHRDWAKLGFIRGIAVSPVMCCSLSTPQWVSLLLRVVKGSLPDGDLPPSNVSAAPLPRQVMSSWKRFDTLLSQFSRANWVMHRERDPQISGIHFISTLMRLMRIFICDSLVIFKVV